MSCLEALRQCRRAVWKHWYSVEELSGAEGTETVRRDLTTKLHLQWWLIYNFNNMIQSLPRCSQPGQTSPPTQRNTSRGHWCSSTLDGSRTGRMGSSVVGRLTNVVVPFNSRFCLAHFGLMSQERSGSTSAAARDALWCHALLGMVVR